MRFLFLVSEVERFTKATVTRLALKGSPKKLSGFLSKEDLLRLVDGLYSKKNIERQTFVFYPCDNKGMKIIVDRI